jgi:hypothetical protein
MSSLDDTTCFAFEATPLVGWSLSPQDNVSSYLTGLSSEHNFVHDNLASEMQKQRGRKRLRKKRAQEVLRQEWAWRASMQTAPICKFNFLPKLPSEMDALCYRYSCGLGPPRTAEELAYLDLQAKRGVSS